MNLPGAIIDLPVLEPKDEEDITEFGLKQAVDMVGAAFVRKASDVEMIRDVLGPKGAHMKIISKIENLEGLHNFDEILAATDGVIISRQSLAMELSPEKVFIAQKWMIEKCNLAAKPVMIASCVLPSLMKNQRPRRAEASDIVNAVLDGTDCIMLGEETATGPDPVNMV